MVVEERTGRGGRGGRGGRVRGWTVGVEVRGCGVRERKGGQRGERRGEEGGGGGEERAKPSTATDTQPRLPPG